MQPAVTAIPTLAVSMIYCLWYCYQQLAQDRRKRVRERVTFLLWTAANGGSDHAPYDD